MYFLKVSLLVFIISVFILFEIGFEYDSLQYRWKELEPFTKSDLLKCRSSFSYLSSMSSITATELNDTFQFFFGKNATCAGRGAQIIINKDIYIRLDRKFDSDILFFDMFLSRRIRNTLQWLFKLQKANLLPDQVSFLINFEDRLAENCSILPATGAPILSWSKDRVDYVVPFLPMGVDMRVKNIKLSWKKKKNIFFWRGSLTHSLRENLVNMTLSHALMDARFVTLANCKLVSRLYNNSYYIKNQLMAPRVKLEEFAEAKFLLDIDGGGWSSRFRNLFAMGSAILKFETNYTEFFYPLLEEGVNIFWVKTIEELRQKIDFLNQHPDLVEKVAFNSHAMNLRINTHLAMHYASNLLEELKLKNRDLPLIDENFKRVYEFWNQPLAFF